MARSIQELMQAAQVEPEVALAWLTMPRLPNTEVADADRAAWGHRVNWRAVRSAERAAVLSTAKTIEQGAP